MRAFKRHRVLLYLDIANIQSARLLQDFSLINVINDAVFRQDPLPEMQPHCPSGNCTFVPFTSLGFCSKCEDISQLFQEHSTYVDGCYSDPWVACLVQRNYTYRLPQLNGQVLTTWTNSWLEASNGSLSLSFYLSDGWQTPIFLVIPLVTDYSKPFKFTDGTSYPVLSLITSIRISNQVYDAGAIIKADLCALSFCAQERNVSLLLNRASSTMHQTVHGTRNSYDSLDANGNPFTWLSFKGDNFNMTFPPHVSEHSVPTASADTWQANIAYLISYLSGNMTKPFKPDGGHYNESTVTSNLIGGFEASPNISMTMDNVATALTNFFRASSNVSVSGQSGQVEIYVHVSWPWIALPASVITAGTFLLILVIYESKRSGGRIWKTSELPLLFQGLEEQDQKLNEIQKVSEMEHTATKIRAQMVKTSAGGFVLRQHGNPADSPQ